MWTLVSIYIACILLLNIPVVQNAIAHTASTALEKKIGAKVILKRVDLGIFNRVIIDGFEVYDRHQKPLLKSSRLSVKLSLYDLLCGKINITSAQFFNMYANIYKETATSDLNCQFIIDAFKSDEDAAETSLNFDIKSLVIRNSGITFDNWHSPVDRTQRKLDFNHIDIRHLNAHLSFAVQEDSSISASLKNLSFQEHSGLVVKALHFGLSAKAGHWQVRDFTLRLPESFVKLSDFSLYHSATDRSWHAISLNDNMQLNGKVFLPDMGCLIPSLKQVRYQFNFSSKFGFSNQTATILNLSLHSRQMGVRLAVSGMVNFHKRQNSPHADIKLHLLDVRQQGIDELIELGGLPLPFKRLHALTLRGQAKGYVHDFSINGSLSTDLGKADVSLSKIGTHVTGQITDGHFDLGRLFAKPALGSVDVQAFVKGDLSRGKLDLKGQGSLSNLVYNGYTYRSLDFNGRYLKSASDTHLEASLDMDDPNGSIKTSGTYLTKKNIPTIDATIQVKRFCPSVLRLTNRWGDSRFDADIAANFSGRSLNEALGFLRISDFSMTGQKGDFTLKSLHVDIGKEQGKKNVSVTSDFGTLNLRGNFDYTQLPFTLSNLVKSYLPSMPGLSATKTEMGADNDFSITAHLNNSDFISKFFTIPVNIFQPADLQGYVHGRQKQVALNVSLPHFEYNGNRFKNGHIVVSSPNDSLKMVTSFIREEEEGKELSVAIKAAAVKDYLLSTIEFDNGRTKRLRGALNAQTSFFFNEKKQATAHVKVLPSHIFVSDSTWNIEPCDIVYSKDNLIVDHFAVEHNKQHIIVSGLASRNKSDKLILDLKEVDVGYLLNLLNFHAVSFGGEATGVASISSIFHHPEMEAQLSVDKFKFQEGNLGLLRAKAVYDSNEGKINIDAVAEQDGDRKTLINGFVSPLHDNIDLTIRAQKTNIEFLKSFCGSFMDDINASAAGAVRLAGPLGAMNLTGELVADGTIRIIPTNTTYRLANDTIRMIPDHIILSRDSVYDRNGNLGIVNGVLRHQNLTQLTYDLNITARNLLSYETHEFGDNTFYGTAYTSGTCHVYEHNGEISLDIDVTPERGSQFVYNTASPGGVGNQEFIHWRSPLPPTLQQHDSLSVGHVADSDEKEDTPSNMRINFLINMTPYASLKLLMDDKTGDYISLYGNGVLRASYFNKGRFEMYGNYVIDHGTYKLTIQNIVKKEFLFNQGGTIAFGGDPYAAALDLKAQYTVPAVSLADLNMGQSFTTNNVKVNCFMNISGTPANPRLDFSLDIPTLNNEAKQMVYSVINSENEMNQQVLYLLAVGRFYSQNNQNAEDMPRGMQQSQTSLAMQSILSGTVSQQINNVLSSLTKNDNWNFGANISTGNEGWNNAEYEGLLSGRLLNNRLLVNGQFGYRDNPATSTSFIGDFEAKYLLTPNGNFSIRVYNQSNDRYFTRNSLNTQGIGLVIKKEFNGWKHLFKKKKKKK